MLLFTGCRLREILQLRWSEVDFERGVLLPPDSKTGRKTVVLNAPALQVLAEVPRIGGRVRHPRRQPEEPRADLHKPWDLITHHAGLADVRVHDLRHTHASVGAGAGLGLPIIGKLLGHKHADTTARTPTSTTIRCGARLIGSAARSRPRSAAGRRPPTT